MVKLIGPAANAGLATAGISDPRSATAMKGAAKRKRRLRTGAPPAACDARTCAEPMVQGEDARSDAAGRQLGDRAAQLLPTTVPNRNLSHRAILHVCQVTRGRWHRTTWSAGRAGVSRASRRW